MIKNVHFNVDIYIYLIFVSVVASILMKVLYAFVNAMRVGNAVEHMDQVLAEPEIPERSTEL